MHCPNCDRDTMTFHQRVEVQDVGRLLGVPVHLYGFPGYVCSECKETMPTGELLDLTTTKLAVTMAGCSDLGPSEARFLRKAMQLTQAELAEKLQTSRATVARWESETGGLDGPSSFALRALVGTYFMPEGEEPTTSPEAEQVFATLKKTPRASPPPTYELRA